MGSPGGFPYVPPVTNPLAGYNPAPLGQRLRTRAQDKILPHNEMCFGDGLVSLATR
jgi:hypothetical protein